MAIVMARLRTPFGGAIWWLRDGRLLLFTFPCRIAICYAGITQWPAGLVKSDVALQFGGQSRVALAVGQVGAALCSLDRVRKAPILSVGSRQHSKDHCDFATGDMKRFLGQFNSALSISD